MINITIILQVDVEPVVCCPQVRDCPAPAAVLVIVLPGGGCEGRSV